MLPISFYLAVLFAHGRLHSESEIVAMTSCGYSPNKVLKATLTLSFFTFIFAGFNTLYLAPLAEDEMLSVIEQAESEPGAASLIEGRFHKMSDEGSVIYVEKYNDGLQLQTIFAAHWPEDKNQVPSIVSAMTGKVETKENGTWVTLENGTRYAGRVGQNKFNISDFETYSVHIANREIKSKTRGTEALPTWALIDAEGVKERAELQWRLVIPLSILFLTFMAVPLAKVNPRQGRYSKLLPALSLYLVFFLLLSTARSLIEEGELPVLSIWGVLIIFFLIGISLQMHSVGFFTKINPKKRALKNKNMKESN